MAELVMALAAPEDGFSPEYPCLASFQYYQLCQDALDDTIDSHPSLLHIPLRLQSSVRSLARQKKGAKLTTASTSTVNVKAKKAPSTSPSTLLPPKLSTSELTHLLSKPNWSVRSLLPSPSDSPTPPSKKKTTTTSSSEPTTTPSTQTLTDVEPKAITAKTLHHLLRLSALPGPETPEEESEMLATLTSQLRFVRAIRAVDTAGVAPLRAIRDETEAGLKEQTIGLQDLWLALEAEDVIGQARRPRRPRTELGEVDGDATFTRSMKEELLRRQENAGHIETPPDEIRREEKIQLIGDGEYEDAEEYDCGVLAPTPRQKTVPSGEQDWNVLSAASETAGGRYFVVRSSSAGNLPSETAGLAATGQQ
ncbi:hypothetical protein F5Y17DRAFT_456498 [Xylariaceae sp. FL0594]|nr:hypothetical protein F5Y17DRAFT_456498 [Xylariaceae sp. FL0594]